MNSHFLNADIDILLNKDWKVDWLVRDSRAQRMTQDWTPWIFFLPHTSWTGWRSQQLGNANNPPLLSPPKTSPREKPAPLCPHQQGRDRQTSTLTSLLISYLCLITGAVRRLSANSFIGEISSPPRCLWRPNRAFCPSQTRWCQQRPTESLLSTLPAASAKV